MRLIDFCLSFVGTAILSPLLLTVAVIIRLTSPGPALYLATRVGKDGQLFRLMKFRSMIVGADSVGPGITASGDSRVTTVGRFLRRTKLDELPQLFNVLKGEMSLVGPRPEDPRYVSHYTPMQRQVLRVRPGITSAASLAFRHEERMLSGPDWESRYVREVMPAKLAIDLEYLARRTVWTDLSLTIRSVAVMVK